MKTTAACLLVAALGSGSAMAQSNSNQPLNGQVNTQLDTRINSQVNTGGAPSGAAGINSARSQAMPPAAAPGWTGAAIGTPGVTAPLGTVDNRPAMTGPGTTSITNASGTSLSAGATGSSAPINAGTWGTVGPNNVPPTPGPATPDPLALPGSAPGGNPTAAGAPVRR
ncbi:hypothetical protein [Pseudoduganella buxea]|uniref:Uncharacterized protein n=1 Tax=Pseudoduganella buxea TaxID=1949069 RepID=A0A6I3T2W3_9BURK|nr:hypothetical protein [Pseudoduganella buxea]MTV55918.1 hypothetical protein [Pseudoduganella buxea]GGB99521.1 hypothetical protein GCM10011572_21810 [Pseudoduganella buxea]